MDLTLEERQLVERFRSLGDEARAAREAQRWQRELPRPDQPLFVSEALKQTSRIMVKDEDLCVHCGLCAERCPTDAWDMQKSWVTLAHVGAAR